jgi:hypothetical protein
LLTPIQIIPYCKYFVNIFYDVSRICTDGVWGVLGPK